MTRLLATTALALILCQSPVLADQALVTAPVIAQAEAEGFAITDVTRTWLGRILIPAESDTHLREIVLNRHTGEILHDRLFTQQRSSGGESTPPSSLSHPPPAPKAPDGLPKDRKPNPGSDKPAGPGGNGPGDGGGPGGRDGGESRGG